MVVAHYEKLNKLSVMGLPVHESKDYISWLHHQLEESKGTHVVTINAEMCMQAQTNQQLRHFIESADLVTPDGSGIELYFRFMRQRSLRRYPGIELAADLLQSLGPDYKVAFYGGKPEIVQAAAAAWRKRAPQLNLAIVQDGYIKGEREDDFIRQLEQVQPNVIFVGLGVPRQEFWIAQHRHICPNAVWVGVGGSYDIWSGAKARAPRWMCNTHLEWLYRLYQEPWRWRRMLALPHFVWASFWYRLLKE